MLNGNRTDVAELRCNRRWRSSYAATLSSAKMTGNQIYVSGNGVCFSGNTFNGNIGEALSATYCCNGIATINPVGCV
jgi:hypothetical protein